MNPDQLFLSHRFAGAVFTILAIVFIGDFTISIDWCIQLHCYLSWEYLMGFWPLMISITLLFGGVYLFRKLSSSNFVLALFGHTASEEILFDWMGFSTTNLPDYAAWIFFVCALIALWLAYANPFHLKPVSLKEAVISLVIGTGFSLML